MRDSELILITVIPILFMALLFWGMLVFGKNQTRQSCLSFSYQSGYETKYVEYTYFRFDCLAKQSDGKWISTENIYANTENK